MRSTSGRARPLDEFPPQVVVDLLDEVTAFVSGRDGCPAVVLDATDTGQRWSIGAGGDAVTLTGTQTALLAWLIGRRRGEPLQSSTGDVPDAPAGFRPGLRPGL